MSLPSRLCAPDWPDFCRSSAQQSAISESQLGSSLEAPSKLRPLERVRKMSGRLPKAFPKWPFLEGVWLLGKCSKCHIFLIRRRASSSIEATSLAGPGENLQAPLDSAICWGAFVGTLEVDSGHFGGVCSLTQLGRAQNGQRPWGIGVRRLDCAKQAKRGPQFPTNKNE